MSSIAPPREICTPIRALCRSCGNPFVAYGPHNGLCPRRMCSQPPARHADLDTPQVCWIDTCTAPARYVVEWFSADARRETCCSAHLGGTFEYATQSSDGFTNPQVGLVPLADRIAVAA